MRNSKRSYNMNQTEILKLMNTINKMKNAIERFNSRLNQAEEKNL